MARPTPTPHDPLAHLPELPEPDNWRGFRRAVVLALVLHAGLLFVHRPETDGAPEPETQEDVFVLKDFQVQPPPPPVEPPPPPPLPEPEARIVPVPDPTPEDPEPIRPLEIEPLPTPRLTDLELPVTLPIPPPPAPAPPAPPEPEPGSDEPIRVGGDVLAPVAVHHPQPAYTPAARRAGIEGVAVLDAVIDEDGNVREVTVLRDPGFGLGDSAREALATWRFEPATLHGEAVAVRYVLTVRFGIVR